MDLDSSTGFNGDVNPGVPTEELAEEAEVGRHGAVAHGAALMSHVTRHAASGGLEHLEGFQLIAQGGVGRVETAYEKGLGRHVAVKTLRPEFRKRGLFVERLVREARATAQLEHPGIVPVHSLGNDPDVGVYFTMRELHGSTLREVLDRRRTGDPVSARKYSDAQLRSVFLRVCQAVAYAHSRGVIHRDLKPENIVIGDFGEVVILDWGLVRRIGVDDDIGRNSVDILLVHEDARQLTLDGAVSGTPKYMSPEQARGDNSGVDERSDVFSLGVLLYEILTLSPPFTGDNTMEVLRRVTCGAFIPPRRAAPKAQIPLDLEAICLKAMTVAVEGRYQAVQEMIDDLYAYQGGHMVSSRSAGFVERSWKLARRHPVKSSMATTVLVVLLLAAGAIGLVQYARYASFMDRGRANMQLGEAQLVLAHDASVALGEERSGRMEGAKSTRERRLAEVFREHDAKATNHLDLAVLLLNSVPLRYRNSAPVRDALRKIYEKRLEYCLKTQQYDSLRRWLGLLKLDAIEPGKKETEASAESIRQAETALQGMAVLSLHTEPASADAKLHPLVERFDRGIISADPPIELGLTPLSSVRVRPGDYLLVVRAGDLRPVYYAMRLRHGEDVHVRIETPQRYPDGMTYIPAGAFLYGDEGLDSSPQRQEELASFFIRTTEVTFGEYHDFWLQLVDPGQRQSCMSHVGFTADTMVPTPAWDADGRYAPNIQAERPVVGITQSAARAYCAWLAQREGVPYRLPTAMEWEKAARGADGRIYPWGNGYKPEYAFTLENHEARQRFGLWAPPSSFPMDRSVYGVMDLAGNVREWTSTTFIRGGSLFQIRGASASTTQRFLPSYHASDAPFYPSDVGFRYVVSLDDWREATRKVY